MKVRDVMNTKPITIGPDANLGELIALFKENNIRVAPVVDRGKLVGIVSQCDVLDVLEVHGFSGLWLPAPFDFIEAVLDLKEGVMEVKKKFDELKTTRVRDIMEKNVHTASLDMHVSKAAEIMTEKDFTLLPVIDQGRLVGVVTRSDLVRSML